MKTLYMAISLVNHNIITLHLSLEIIARFLFVETSINVVFVFVFCLVQNQNNLIITYSL